MSGRSRKSGSKAASGHPGKPGSRTTSDGLADRSFLDRHFRLVSLATVFLVAWIAYANALHDNLTFDDITFSPGNRSSELSLSNIKNYFTSDVWASSGKHTGLYRPVFLLSVAVESNLFGEWYVGYHLVNVLLHSLVCLALFGLARYLLLGTGCTGRAAGYAALLVALIYAVHPLNTEVVNSIFNRSGMLVTLGVLGGLLWFLPQVKKSPWTAWLGINLVFLVILFCKEDALMFPAILAAALFIDTAGDWRTRIGKCLPVLSMLIPIAVFFALRSMAINPAAASGAVAQPITDIVADPVRTSMLANIQLGIHPEKLSAATRIWFDGLVKAVWPPPLYAFHGASKTSLWLAAAAQAGLLVVAFVAFWRKHPLILFGLIIYYLAMLPSSRIVSPQLAATFLVERHFYLPLAGLAISLSFVLYRLIGKFTLRAIAPLALIPVLVFTPITWARNADWVSTVSVVQSDYDRGNRNVSTLQILLRGLIVEEKFSRATRLCDQNENRLSWNWFISASCGQAYEKTGQTDKAVKAYELSLEHGSGAASGHYSLAMLYLRQRRNAEAESQFEQAIAAERQKFMKEFLRAEMLISLYPGDRARLLEARNHLEKAIRLRPQVVFFQQKLAQLDQMLASLQED